MEGPAAAAAGGGQPEGARPADAQTAEPPSLPKRGQDAAGPQQTDGAATAAPAGGSAGRAPGVSPRPAGGGQHKRKPGRPALHQGCQVRC